MSAVSFSRNFRKRKKPNRVGSSETSTKTQNGGETESQKSNKIVPTSSVLHENGEELEIQANSVSSHKNIEENQANSNSPYINAEKSQANSISSDKNDGKVIKSNRVVPSDRPSTKDGGESQAGQTSAGSRTGDVISQMTNGGGEDVPLEEKDSATSGKVELKRNVGLLSGIALIIGTMIGSGIFISPKGMLEGSGSVGLTLILWILCGLLTTMGALVYAELGTMVPESGGEHAYLMFTFDKARRRRLQAGLPPLADAKRGQGSQSFARAPAFMYDWVALFIIRPTMFAIMAMALGTYAVKPLYPDCEPPTLAVKLTTAVAMCVIAFINCSSVKAATYVQNITTVTKLVALAVISLGGLIMLFKGNTESFEDGFSGTTSDPSTVAIAFYNGLWAFDGWNSLNFITEELKDPTKNLPRAIMIGIPLTTLAYVLANIGYLAVMSKEEIMLSHAVAVTWGDRMLGVMSWIIPCFVVASTFGSSNGCLFSSGRLTFSAGRDGHFPKVLSFLKIGPNTPMPAVTFTLVLSLMLIIPGDLSSLIDFFSFASWLFYGLTTASLLILRVTEPDMPRPYRVPTVIPVIVLLASIYLVLAPIIQNPGTQFLYAVIFILAGLVVYVPFVYRGVHFNFMDKVTIAAQKLLQLAPIGS